MKNALKALMLMLLILCTLLVFACGQPDEDADESTETTTEQGKEAATHSTEESTDSETETETETSAPPLVMKPGKTDLTSDVVPLRNHLMDYSLAMFKDIAADGSKNVLFSPYSVFAATAMVTEGAKGQTLSELETLMGVGQADLVKAYGLYWGDAQSENLLSANSVWVDTYEGLTVNEDTFAKLQSAYAAGVFHRDLQDPATVDALNQWVSEHTKGRIPEIVDDFDPSVRLSLVNALSFDAEWSMPYADYQQKDGTFRNADGTTSTANMLSSIETYYLEDENAQGFYKLYQRGADGKSYAFVAVLPKEGMTPVEYLATLNGDGLRNMLFNYTTDVELYTKMPAFKAETSYELVDTYRRLGCTNPMTELADFTGLATSDNPIFISHITHKAMIEVDAMGTKAGAATDIGMAEGCGPLEPPPRKDVILDRPFIYMILDCTTGLPIFMGITSSVA